MPTAHSFQWAVDFVCRKDFILALTDVMVIKRREVRVLRKGMQSGGRMAGSPIKRIEPLVMPIGTNKGLSVCRDRDSSSLPDYLIKPLK
jgi:hypothetical protein